MVDDDPYIRQLSAQVLIRQGYAVNAAGDGAAAWENLQICDYDLLITDQHMPNVTGLELVRKLRTARMSLPVILSSGGLPAADLEREAWLQPVTALPKPYSAGDLLAAVSDVLAQLNDLSVRREIPPGSRAAKPLSQIDIH